MVSEVIHLFMVVMLKWCDDGLN